MTLSVAPRAVYLRCSLHVGIWDGLSWPATYSDPLNFTKAELTAPAQEKEELISNMIESYGSAIDSQNKPTESAQGAFEFSTMTPDMMAITLGADVTEGTQAAGVVALDTVTTVLGLWVPLANSHLAAHGTGTEIALKTSADVAVLAAKYEIDLVLGMIKAIHADAVGTGMKLSYSKANRTWEDYAAGQAKSVYVHLKGRAYDGATQKMGTLNIWRASLAPSSALDPVAGGYFNAALAGSLIAPAGKSSPWNWQPVTA